MKFHTTALCLLAANLFAGAAEANLLTNGSFETPDIVASNNYQLFSLGSTGITGWAVVGGPVALLPDTIVGLSASDGRQWVDLTGIYDYNKGLKSNTVTTTPGQTYTLSFDIGAYSLSGNASISASINGATPTVFSNVYQNGIMDWERKSLNWVANSNSASITFLGAANGSLSNRSTLGLDNVTFEATPVPVPTAAWLLGSGLLSLVGVARRKDIA